MRKRWRRCGGSAPTRSIPLASDDAALQAVFEREFAAGVDVVLDYLWGASAERLLIAAARNAPEAVPIRFVQIGAMSAPEINLPAAALRSSAIVLMGSGINSVPAPRLLAAIAGVFRAARPAGFEIANEVAPLSEVERRWSQTDSSRRLVFAPGA